MEKLLSKSAQNSICLFCFSIIIIIILIVVVIKIIDFAQKKKAKFLEYVRQTSPRYNAILELNKHYSFEPLTALNHFDYSLPSKASFDHFNFYSTAVSEIGQSIYAYKRTMSIVDKNRDLYQKYEMDLAKIPNILDKKEVKKLGVKYKKYNTIENQITKKALLDPVTSCAITISISYISPKGRNRYSDFKTFSTNEVKEMITLAESKQRVTKTTAYQRSLMTDSLRYDVMKRDSFRCVLCGKTADDGIRLEVDHIKPVSKGGKTEIDNLRTLCNICNSGKRAKYDPFGKN